MLKAVRISVLLLLLLSAAILTPGAVASYGGIPSGESQTTCTVFMVSPDDFAFNQETAQSNLFQNKGIDSVMARNRAMTEFSRMVKKLRSSGIRVLTIPSRRDVKTPDAVFPNNWFSLHKLGSGERILVGYPMLAANRRAERRIEELRQKLLESNIKVSRIIDLSRHEEEGRFLEGTGSMVLDRVHRIAYASLSPRTDRNVLADFSEKLGYRPVAFSSYDSGDRLIYHTNVMMSVGDHFAVVCAEAIRDTQERAAVLKELEQSGKKVVTITLDQVRAMCGNILQLRAKGKKFIVMSTTALEHFTPEQKKVLGGFGRLIPVNIKTIETIGGGSSRCMLGEVY